MRLNWSNIIQVRIRMDRAFTRFLQGHYSVAHNKTFFLYSGYNSTQAKRNLFNMSNGGRSVTPSNLSSNMAADVEQMHRAMSFTSSSWCKRCPS